jgi:uncharacterized protein (UPF0276 family)
MSILPKHVATVAAAVEAHICKLLEEARYYKRMFGPCMFTRAYADTIGGTIRRAWKKCGLKVVIENVHRKGAV